MNKFVFTLLTFFYFAAAAFSSAYCDERPEVFVQMGHSFIITSVAFSPDGKYALSGSLDHSMKLWDVRTGREVKTFKGHQSEVASVAFSPDGKYALSGSWDATMKLWEVVTGKEVRTFNGHSDTITSVAFSPDGEYALSGSTDKTMKLWNVSTGREVKTFKGHSEWVNSVAFSADGKYVLSGSNDKTMKLWDVATGSEVKTFTVHQSEVDSVAFSPNGKYALSGSKDHTMKLWELSTGKEIRTFARHSGNVAAVAFSPDGKYALSGSGDIKLWEVSTGREIRTYPGGGTSVAFSPDGKYALSGCWYYDKTINMRLWEVATGREVRAFEGHPASIFSVAFSPDGKYALSGRSDKTIELWDVSAGRYVRMFQGHSESVASIAFSPDSKYALSGSSDKTMKLWDVPTGKEIRTFVGHSESVKSVAFSPDGKYALSGSSDKTMKLWNVATGSEVRTFKGHSQWVGHIAFSPDGNYALSGSGDATMKLWEVSTGSEVRTFKGHSSSVYSVAFSSDGKYAESGSWDGTVKLWDVATGSEVKTFHEDANDPATIAYSLDRKYAVTAGLGETKFWNAATGKEICRLVAFENGEWVTITPEGYFNSSPNGAKHLNVRVGNNVYGIDQFYAKFYRPELVRLALAGKELPKGESLTDVLAGKPAPSVRILSPQSGTADKDVVTLSVTVTDNGGGIGATNIYLNGSQVANDTRSVIVKGKGSSSERLLSFDVPLIEGRNDIKVVAFNEEGSMESNPAVITIISKAVLQKPNLYAIVVGINEYRNKSISLTYAVPDANAFAEVLRKTAGPLFDKVHIKTLLTLEDTTKESITRVFEEMRGKIKPNDLFVFYNASHGVVDMVDEEEQYFLLTSNVLLLSSRHIGKDAISQKELAKLVGNIPAQKKLIILDTCNAGKGGKEIQIALLQQTRGLTEATAVKLLQRAIGSSVFSASSDTQQALEGYKGHGLFTYVLLEGLQGKADVKKDGFITIYGLADYVDEQVIKLSEEIFKRQQTPTIQTGVNFPIGRVTNN